MYTQRKVTNKAFPQNDDIVTLPLGVLLYTHLHPPLYYELKVMVLNNGFFYKPGEIKAAIFVVLVTYFIDSNHIASTLSQFSDRKKYLMQDAIFDD